MAQPSPETMKLLLTLIRPISEKIWREQQEKKAEALNQSGKEA